jgi:arsenite methyltransferase
VAILEAKSAVRSPVAVSRFESLAQSVTESFAGVENPLALGELRAGQTVLDLGSGAGLDSILAARRVASTGKVIGIDFAAEMVEKATRNALTVGATNAEFRQGEADALPISTGSVDVVISNGVFNLCLDKPNVLAEAFRVLRPGGRIQMADILL